MGKGRAREWLQAGDWGLRAEEPGRLSARQLEAARRARRRRLPRSGRIWRRVFPHRPVTSKPSEVRRGRGKGAVAYWATYVRPGSRLFEVGGRLGSGGEAAVHSALAAAASKLPVAVRRVRRRPVQP